MLKIWVLAAVAVAVAYGEDSDDLYRGQRYFAGNMLDSLRQLHPKENLFFSPHSTYKMLILAYLGANGKTQQSLADGMFLKHFRLEDKSNLISAYKRASRARPSRSSIKLNSVDRVYITKDAQLKSHITDVFRNNEIEKVDFSKPEQVRTDINTFVEKVTEGHIKDLMPAGSVFASMNGVLVNAVHFVGTWEKQFDSYQTKDVTFHGDEEKTVQMMLTNAKLNWGELREEDATYIELPYKVDAITDSVSMYIYLPNKETPGAIDELLEKFSGNSIQESFNRASFRQVRVGLPKMDLEGKYYLGEALKKMNIDNVVGGDFSDFADNVQVSFDDILHVAKVQVNEEGTTASAATVSMGRGVDPNLKIFICDRPFIFAIADGSSKEVLFMGVYRK